MGFSREDGYGIFSLFFLLLLLMVHFCYSEKKIKNSSLNMLEMSKIEVKPISI